MWSNELNEMIKWEIYDFFIRNFLTVNLQENIEPSRMAVEVYKSNRSRFHYSANKFHHTLKSA